VLHDNVIEQALQPNLTPPERQRTALPLPSIFARLTYTFCWCYDRPGEADLSPFDC